MSGSSSKILASTSASLKQKRRVKFRCKNCAEDFTIPHCWAYPKNRHSGWSGDFCGRDCKKSWTIKENTRKCRQCRKRFQTRSAPAKSGKTEYCSRKCWNKKALAIGHVLAAHLDNDEYRIRANVKRLAANRIGPKSHAFRGGFSISKFGYLKITSVILGAENKNKLFHRYVMEQHLGRKLNKDEIVHHKDENKLNNDISNLELTNQQDHTRHHHLGKPKPRRRLVAA